MSLIMCQDVSFSYEGVTAISGLNFRVEQGDYLCIVGENGAGKTTLMKGLLRLKRTAGGLISIGDGLRPNEIGYLPQQSNVQKDFPASVYEVVLSGCQNSLGWKPFYGKRQRRLADENLEQLGMTEWRNACYRELSGGQQQRVLLARALCATKKIILLDEPAAGLDPIMTQELYELINKINKEMNITVIMVSHDIQCAVKYANKILHVCREQLFFGEVTEYQESTVGKSFIGGRTNGIA